MQDRAAAGEVISRWGWQVIEPIARPLLESDEFRDALPHAGLSPQAVLERLRNEAAELAFLHESVVLRRRRVGSGFGPAVFDVTDSDRLRERVVVPYLRRLVNEAVNTPDREQEFHVRSATGLTAPSGGGGTAATGAIDEFRRLAATMSSGSIGISGPRGMGKSALLRSLCGPERAGSDDRAPRAERGLIVSAPMGYEVHDFVRHLFEELCRKVLDYPVWRELSSRPRAPLAGRGETAVALAPLRAASDHREVARVRQQMQELLRLRDQARRYLRRLEYTSARTTGYSGGLGLGPSVRFGRSRDHQLTENALALPELIELYREFAAEVGRLRRSRLGQPGGGTLIIGIDEVDRIHDPEAAERFVNGVKAVFGSPYCLYVVAVPQQDPDGRGADLTTAFDESLRMRRLTFADAQKLLGGRLTGISRPFSALCTVLSAGNPRDLLRYARLLIEESRAGATTLEGLSARLVAREVAGVKEVARRVASDGAAIRLLLDESWPGERPEEILAACRRLPGDGRDPLVRDRLLTPLYFLATVAAAFGPDRAATLAELRRDAADGPQPLALLVEARGHLDTHRALAHEMVSRFREARGLGVTFGPDHVARADMDSSRTDGRAHGPERPSRAGGEAMSRQGLAAELRNAVSVRELIRAVSEELIESRAERIASGEPPVFEVDSLDIELSVAVTRSVEKGGGVDIKVVRGDVAVTDGDASVQKIVAPGRNGDVSVRTRSGERSGGAAGPEERSPPRARRGGTRPS